MHTLLNHSLCFILLLLLSVQSCKTTTQTGKSEIDTIDFGSGGGFTGLVTVYTLDSKGQLWKTENQKKIPVKIVDQSKAKRVNGMAVKIKSYVFNEPGNVYSFIDIKGNNIESHLVWSIGSKTISADAKELYNELISLTK